MRKLFITRGIPGAGKSTFLRECGLDAYTIEPDAVRLLVTAPELQMNGTIGISQAQDKKVWEMIYETLERRMAQGELIVVDATHLNARSYRDYAAMAAKYRYTTYVIDFSHVSLDTAHRQNQSRAPHKIVPAEVLDTMYERQRSSTIPKGWQVVTTQQEVAAIMSSTPVDLSQYDTIHHIGDIQGCVHPLERYFQTYPYRETDAYILVGDLVDRGPDNDKVVQYIIDNLLDRPNVYFIEGNHDTYLWQWASNQPVKTREFTGRTQPQLEAAGIDKRAVHRLCRGMLPALHYTHHDREVLVTHAGLSTLPQQLAYISTGQCIRGVGAYDQSDEVDARFVATTHDHCYQVHGHRNKHQSPTQVNERCFNLEGKVEFGGELRAVQLSCQGMTVANITSPETTHMSHPQHAEFLAGLRQNPYIRETTLPGQISSFNFSREAFHRAKWSAMTTKARGLFMNTLSNEIVIRSYDKFFNIDERRETEYHNLASSLQFPVTAWVKENGYLGLLGYDSLSNQLIFASKSTTEGDFALWFEQLFMARYGDQLQTIKQRLSEQNLSLVFEVVHPQYDPHIIEYSAPQLYLLEAVYREQTYRALPIDELQQLAVTVGLQLKHQAAVLTSWAEFASWYEDVQRIDYRYDGRHIEGFVVEDAAGRHVKIKLPYYVFWKQMRTQLDRLRIGKHASVPEHCAYPSTMQRLIDELVTIPSDTLPSLIELQRLCDARNMEYTT